MSAPENPLAFPVQWEFHEAEAGMTLRDWFAGQAMNGWSASWPEGRRIERPQTVAAASYAIADAMLAERAK